MAVYTYECLECGRTFKHDEYDLEYEPHCPKCGSDDNEIIKRGSLDGIVY